MESVTTGGLALETELRLGLPGGGGGGGESEIAYRNEKKRVFSELSGGERKNEVVGWPPVCAFRRKTMKNESGGGGMETYVKVSMDGAPFLRKINLNSFTAYSDLVFALRHLFLSSPPYPYGAGMLEKVEGDHIHELVPIYEDKDGEWMLLGDVPWGIFIETCKRVRIMRCQRNEASLINGSFPSQGARARARAQAQVESRRG